MLKGSASVRLSPAQRAYLLLLCVGGSGGIRRTELIDMLWGEPENRGTRHRIRQLNYGVNQKAGGRVVRAQGAAVLIEPWVPLEWAGEGVWDSVTPPTLRYRDFLDERRQEHQAELARDSVRLLDAARLADSPQAVLDALESGRRPPGAWRELLWALLRTGRVREAEFEGKRLFGEEFEAEGLPAVRRIKRETNRLLSLAAGGGDTSRPLVGREAEVSRIHDLMARGDGCILLTGTHGVGRSRLLGQSISTALSNQDDLIVLSAYGTPSDRERPFGGLGQLLDDDLLVDAFNELGQPDHEVIRRALPVQFESSQSHELAQIGGPGSYLRIAHALEALFKRAYGTAEVLLVVDDLDQIDRSTLEVLTRLILLGAARLLATWCTEGEETHAELLVRFRGVEPGLVPVGELRLEACVELCRNLSGELGLTGAEDLARLGGGRPGRVVELLHAFDGSRAFGSPRGPSLDQLLRRRLRELDETEQNLLTLIALNEGRMEVSLLGELSGRGILETAGYVRQLQGADLIRLEGDRVAVGPRLLTSFINRELSKPVRNRLHARIANLMLENGEPSQPGVLARHLAECGREEEAGRWFRVAGEEAVGRAGYVEAIRSLEHAVRCGADDPTVAQDLGFLSTAVGDFEAAENWYGKARRGFAAVPSPEDMLQVDLGAVSARIEGGAADSGTLSQVQELLAAGRALSDSRSIGQALDLLMVIGDYTFDRVALGIATSELAVELRIRPTDPYIALAGSRLLYMGSPRVGLRCAQRAYLALRQDEALKARALARLCLCLAYSPCRARRRLVLLQEADRLAKGTGDTRARFSLLANQAVWAIAEGDWRKAHKLLDEATGLCGGAKTDRAGTVLVNRAVAFVGEGKLEEARGPLLEFEQARPHPHGTLELMFHSCHVILALEEGRLIDARIHHDQIAWLDLTFPFASDLSFVAFARSVYARRTGRSTQADELLRIRDRLKRLAPPD